MEWFFQIEVNGNFLHKSNSSSIGMEHYSVYTVHAKIPVTEVKDKKKKKKGINALMHLIVNGKTWP